MRSSLYLVALAAIVIADPTSELQRSVQKSVIELAPGETREVTEAEKFALISDKVNFIDVTEWSHSSRYAKKRNITYPSRMTQVSSVQSLTAQLNESNIRANLEHFSSYNNRYYQSETGNQSAEWLLAQARSYVPPSLPVTVSIFEHVYRQSSIIATIPGKSNKTIVVGAHQDSINDGADVDRMTAAAPGADDNGSGSMGILEVFRTILKNETIANGEATNTIEFHWYAAEEIGLLGSGNVFRAYAEEGRDVVAMLNQDMTGYTAGYAARNATPKFGVVIDQTDEALTNFTWHVIRAYTNTHAENTACLYACSDHVSATRAGYPSAFVFEAEFDAGDEYPYIHSANDTIEHVNFTHVMEHAKLTTGFVVELAFANL